MITPADVERLDAADPLSRFQSRYVPQSSDVVAYLDGNSLGRPLTATAERYAAFVPDWWGRRLIRGWSEGWMDLPERVGDLLGWAALGAATGQCLIADSTSVNLYKVLRAAAALRPDRRVIVTDVDNFPTDRYIVEGLATELGWQIRWLQPDPTLGVTRELLAPALGDDVGVVTLSHVAYRSAFVADAAGITADVHDAGALVVWDLCHSIGAVPVDLDDWQVDFAVGCTYKFVGAGPGAPAVLYAAQRHHDAMVQPIWGWLGRADPFEMEAGYRPAAGIRSMMSGTPPIPGVLAVSDGATIIADAGIAAIRQKSMTLTEFVVELADEMLAPLGFRLASPRDPERRGGHVTLSRGDARELTGRLTAAGVLVDFRTPDAIRLGLSPLPLGFAEIYRAVQVIAAVAAG